MRVARSWERVIRGNVKQTKRSNQRTSAYGTFVTLDGLLGGQVGGESRKTEGEFKKKLTSNGLRSDV